MNFQKARDCNLFVTTYSCYGSPTYPPLTLAFLRVKFSKCSRNPSCNTLLERLKIFTQFMHLLRLSSTADIFYKFSRDSSCDILLERPATTHVCYTSPVFHLHFTPVGSPFSKFRRDPLCDFLSENPMNFFSCYATTEVLPQLCSTRTFL